MILIVSTILSVKKKNKNKNRNVPNGPKPQDNNAGTENIDNKNNNRPQRNNNRRRNYPPKVENNGKEG